jgi:virginiamycin B lyase
MRGNLTPRSASLSPIEQDPRIDESSAVPAIGGYRRPARYRVGRPLKKTATRIRGCWPARKAQLSSEGDKFLMPAGTARASRIVGIRLCKLLLVAAAAILLTIGVGRANAAAGPRVVFTSFEAPVVLPYVITPGPDGALWFTTVAESNYSIGRITTKGKVTVYRDKGIDSPNGITAGRDGALWFTNDWENSIGRISTSGEVRVFRDPRLSFPAAITAGSDGALWFTNLNADSMWIGRITTRGKISIYWDQRVKSSNPDPVLITTGPDRAVWFTNGTNIIGRMTTKGKVTLYRSRSINEPHGLTKGPDGALWFTNWGNNSIGRITTKGKVSVYRNASIKDPGQITSAPDGALWFTNGKNTIGQITTNGRVTVYRHKSINLPSGITAGPDGAVWFTNFSGKPIGRAQILAAR